MKREQRNRKRRKLYS